MKNVLIILAAIAFALVSCNHEVLDNTADEASQTDIVFELTANHPNGADTKAVKTGWENGDVIYVFFNNVAAPKYLKMIYDGSSWSTTQMNGASAGSLGLTEGSSGTMRAVFLPFGSELSVSADGTSFTFGTITYSYYLTATLGFTVTDGKVSGAFNIAIPDGYIQFFLDDANASASTRMELREPHLTPQGIASVAADGTITHTTIARGAPLKGYYYDKTVKQDGESKGYLFSGILAAEARNVSTDYHFTLVYGHANGWLYDTYYCKAFTGKTWYRGATEGRALKVPALGNWTQISDYLPIDLGCDITVGGVKKRIYWCSRNLGATQSFRPAEVTDEARRATWGDYYAWGETTPYYTSGHAYDNPNSSWADGKTGYNDASYRYTVQVNDKTKFTKYCPSDKSSVWGGEGSPDNILVLDPADDAATQNVRVNGNTWIWRTPTYSEWVALRNATNYIWVSQHKGREVESKVAGYQNRRIFLPAAGFRDGTGLASTESKGYYWSADLCTSNLSLGGWYKWFEDPDGYDYDLYGSLFRHYGYSVRPVSD
ncbi:MAG: hypothetical protein J5646_08110 [Bacteroidales bacterium]|nr:hypothetical protein [Bacteroidales bacterium]